MHTFSVEAQDGIHMNMIGARGDCKLAITGDSEILCALAPTRQVVGVWPFNTLRRYWCGDGVFGFEAGKRSPRGEGVFTFISTRDEEIYTIMKQYIDKAKEATLQRKRHRKGAKEEVMDVNMRPKLPLPREVATPPDSPVLGPVSDDDMTKVDKDRQASLQYESIPVQRDDLVGLPSAFQPPLKRGTSLHTDISGPSPAYVLKRSQTSKPRRVQQWLHNTKEAMQEFDENQIMEAVGGDSLVPEDDTYSHTRHIMPAQFQQHATDHNIIDESTYHTLVHNGKPATKLKKGEEGVDPLYSLAYPPRDGVARGSRQVRLLPGSEYATLEGEGTDSGPTRGRTLSNLPLAPAKTAGEREEMEDLRQLPHYPLTSPAQQAPANDPRGLEESMTDNPLYDSQADILEALANSEREGKGASPQAGGPERLDTELTEDDRDRDVRSGEGGEIQRDSKGYTKVDKSKKKKQCEKGVDLPDSQAPPPPLPPRLYEGAEDEAGLQGHSDVMMEPMSPTSECDSVAVSDV